MIDLHEIEDTISQLEARKESMYVCERLAALYIVRDHLRSEGETQQTPKLSGSEFLESCNGVAYTTLMNILDEHMSAMKLVFPKEYDKVMTQLDAQG